MQAFKSVLREPIVHFLFAGAILYGVGSAYADATAHKRIVVTEADVAQLTRRHVQQFGTPPSPERLDYLIERHIRDEALYREGMALGLGQDDEVVRRRIIQKMDFLGEDDAGLDEPSESDLQAFYHANAERYRTPARTSFTHLYFSPDRGGDDAALSRATAALAALRAGAVQPFTLGDNFPNQQNFALLSPRDTERVFGKSPLAQALHALPLGMWSGPLRSGYGWHLVKVEARQPGRLPDPAEITDDLRSDWQDDKRTKLRDARMARLLGGYEIVRDDLAAGGSGT